MSAGGGRPGASPEGSEDVLANWVPQPDTIPTFSPSYHPSGQVLLLSPAQLRRQRSFTASEELGGWGADPDGTGQGTLTGRGSEGCANQQPANSTFLTEVQDGQAEEKPRVSLFEWHAQMRKAVQRDIKRTLNSSKAIMRQAKGPVPISQASISRLASPKAPDPDTAKVREDPIEYARWKANQLRSAREASEAAIARREREQAEAHTQLAAFLEAKQQAKERMAADKARVQSENEVYGRRVASYVHQRAQDELGKHRRRVEQAHEKAAQLHAQATQGFW